MSTPPTSSPEAAAPARRRTNARVRTGRASGQPRARLRVCASCEWIFDRSEPAPARSGEDALSGCPRCGFAHYGARFVYGNAAYRHARTQEPWLQRGLLAEESRLRAIIRESKKAARASGPDGAFRTDAFEGALR